MSKFIYYNRSPYYSEHCCSNPKCEKEFSEYLGCYMCDNCEQKFCNKKCAEIKGKKGCIYCQGQIINNHDLFYFLLKKNNLTIPQVVEMYEEHHNKNEKIKNGK